MSPRFPPADRMSTETLHRYPPVHGRHRVGSLGPDRVIDGCQLLVRLAVPHVRQKQTHDIEHVDPGEQGRGHKKK